MPVLVVKERDRKDRAFLFQQDKVVLGRSPGATLTLPNVAVSRRHARMVREPEGYVLEDLGSENGLLVNDRRAKRTLLKSGDVIRIGKFTLIYVMESAPELYRDLGVGAMPLYGMPGSGDQDQSTYRLSNAMKKQLQEAARRLNVGHLVCDADPEESWLLGDQAWGLGPKETICVPTLLGKGRLAQLTWSGNEHVLAKVSKLATVKVNGDKVTECMLVPGDKVQVGKRSFTYRLKGSGKQRT